MANDFGQFFIRKIENVHLKLDSLQTLAIDEGELSQLSFSGTPFTVFQPVLTDEIEKLEMKAPSKTCDNDPVPTQVVKACINELLPSISNIVNSSLSSPIVPDIWNSKEALVKPKLKKSNLDLILKKNYRPVSNLTFLSKIAEKVVAQQILQHMSSKTYFRNFNWRIDLSIALKLHWCECVMISCFIWINNTFFWYFLTSVLRSIQWIMTFYCIALNTGLVSWIAHLVG